jgi:hypothetical protein
VSSAAEEISSQKTNLFIARLTAFKSLCIIELVAVPGLVLDVP